MRRRPRPTPDVPLLTLEVLDFCLRYSRTNDEIEALHAHGVHYDSFAAFDLDQLPRADFLHLWHQHEDEIVAEAGRRGVVVPDPATYDPYPCGRWL